MSNHTPKVIIEDIVYHKIMHWVDKCSVEISGLGKIEQRSDGNLYVIDAILLPQKNSSVTTDIEPEDVGKAMFMLKDAPGELRFWWHSHVNMDVFWSGTDISTIKKLAEPGWFVNTVFNKKREMRTAIAFGQPFPVIIDNVTTEVIRHIDHDMIAQWDKDFDTKVKMKESVGTKNIKRWSPGKGVHEGKWPDSAFAFDDTYSGNMYSGVRENGYLDDNDGFGSYSELQFGSSTQSASNSTDVPIHTVTQSKLKELIVLEQALELELDDVSDLYEAALEKGDDKQLAVIATRERHIIAQLDDVADTLDEYEELGLISAAERIGSFTAHDASKGKKRKSLIK